MAAKQEYGKCPDCGGSLSNKQGALYCKKCHHHKLICLKCRTKVKFGAQTCPHCGAQRPLTREEAQKALGDNFEDDPPTDTKSCSSAGRQTDNVASWLAQNKLVTGYKMDSTDDDD